MNNWLPAELERISGALADPTRLRIYQFLRENGRVTAKRAAEAVEIHRTVARLHLEKLYAAELVEKEPLQSGKSGRPAFSYSLVERRTHANQLLHRTLSALSCILAEAGEKTLAAVADSGREYGRESVAPADLSTDGGVVEGGGSRVAAELKSALHRAGRPASAVFTDLPEIHIECPTCPYEEATEEESPNTLLCEFDKGLLLGVADEVFRTNESNRFKIRECVHSSEGYRISLWQSNVTEAD